ncbi:MAG TPA: 23S rRNA (uracil(1939)-C(5))-methyltransferase RlmD [Rhodocyclaceae bacterium]|nr:23S rRNA (uracil(1939)-C(5))-methyltransferase RlmD [Rhodocyclaceae bacterium]
MSEVRYNPVAFIESLDHEGRGVAHVEGKAIFVEGALPGERVEYSSYRKKDSYEKAQLTRIVKASSQRVTPRCPHFGMCGGCSMQHLDSDAQASIKQRVLEDAFWHIGKLRPEVIFPPITGPAWGYRYRARLSVRLVQKKGGVLVGFHERKSSYVAEMGQCEVLPPHVSALIMPLRALVTAMSIPDRLPQIEVAVGDEQTALVFRHLEALTEKDESLLRTFADSHKLTIYLQPKGPDTVHLFYPTDVEPLFYSLPEFGVKMQFRPVDFTQVNHGINRMLLRRALKLLDPQPGERVADMFCGLGNFTLPIARTGATVVGVEGAKALVDRALENAKLNGLDEHTEFGVSNLFEATEESIAALGHFDRMLIDPPREGAAELCRALGEDAPERIVYVSCSPATLARDAAILVHEKGYRLKGAGIANMFPQTSHVESIALFERL